VFAERARRRTHLCQQPSTTAAAHRPSSSAPSWLGCLGRSSRKRIVRRFRPPSARSSFSRISIPSAARFNPRSRASAVGAHAPHRVSAASARVRQGFEARKRGTSEGLSNTCRDGTPCGRLARYERLCGCRCFLSWFPCDDDRKLRIGSHRGHEPSGHHRRTRRRR
jgi:hypothetical protein